MKPALFFIMLITASCTRPAHNANSVLVKELERGNTPSVQYVLFNGQGIIHEFRRGFTGSETNMAVTAKTTFNGYSITKTMTALAVVQLAEQGKIHLDSSIRHYLPDLPLTDDVTIRHLLSHTAGLSDPIPLSWIHLAERDSTFDADAFFGPIMERTCKNASTPGEKLRYSNLGYVLLGHIIAQASGMPYNKYIAQHLISPLNLMPGSLGFRIPDTRQHATGYHKRWSLSYWLLTFFIDKDTVFGPAEGPWKPMRPVYVNGAAYGGIIASTEGLVSYLQQFLIAESLMVPAKTKELLFTETKTNNGNPTGMCLSWFTGTLNNIRYFTHAGGGGGYYVEMRVYPDEGIGSVLVFNRSGMRDERFLDKLDTFFLGDGRAEHQPTARG